MTHSLRSKCFLGFKLLLVVPCFLIASTSFGNSLTQNFDTDPGWTSVGSGTNGNNFGYQTSSNAGGSPGEAGGTFTRGTTGRIYADTNFGTLSLNQPFSASGLFNYTAAVHPDFGPAFGIGHFLVVGNPLAGDISQIGIGFGSNGLNQLYWFAFVSVGAPDGGQGGVFGSPTYIDANVDRTWSYSWDPNGGVNGGGELTDTLSGDGGGTETLDLTPTQRATLAPASVNAFGLSVSYPTLSNSSEFANIFIDDVTYTVPEPASIVYAIISGAILFPMMRRRRSILAHYV